MTNNYQYPVVFGALAAGDQALSQFDTDFDASARMGTLPCTATGTNDYVLTPIATVPTMATYGNYQKVSFIAPNTSTTVTTIAVGLLAALNAYEADGTTRIGSGGVVAGTYYEYAYNSTLNAAAGGWQKSSSSAATTLPILSVKTQTFTTTGTYTPNSGMAYCIGFVQGAGGGGGGTLGDAGKAGAGGGGGGGTTVQFYATAAQIGASRVVTIGAGGAGGTAGTNNGTAGGTSSLGALVICPGGFGGIGGTSETVPTVIPNIGVAFSATVTTVTTLLSKTGAGGGCGLILNGTTGVISGTGGSSLFGSGGDGIAANNIAGFTGGIGAGGGGGCTTNSNTDRAGGAGGAGFVVITEYCTS